MRDLSKQLFYFLLIILVLIIIDQAIKYAMIHTALQAQNVPSLDLKGFYMIADNPVISLALVFNTGVAFSMLTGLGEWLKYIQVFLIFAIMAILYSQKPLFKAHFIPFAMMLGGGLSNVLDRFLHGGVVDYIYWHLWFDFPIFNFADIIIDCGIAFFILQILFAKKLNKKENYGK